MRRFILLIFLLSCEDPTAPTYDNPVSESLNQYLDLRSPDSGLYKDQVTIEWNPISSSSGEYSLTSSAIDTLLMESSFVISNLSDGASLFVLLETNSFSESIWVHTRPVAPIIWDEIYFGGTNTEDTLNILSWQISSDNDIDYQRLYIYNLNDDEDYCPSNIGDVDLFSWDLDSILTSETISYNHLLLNTDEAFCYLLEVIDSSGNSRNSWIIGNNHHINSTPPPAISISPISQNLNGRIMIDWEEYPNDDFFQYTLYRNDDATFPDNSTQQLIEITDISVSFFEDRDNLGQGKVWYYQVEITNYYGYSSMSEIESGKSKP